MPQADLTLSDCARKILGFLGKHRPTLATQYDVEIGIKLSRRTIGPALMGLRAKGLVHRPQGDRKGETLTEAGARLLQSQIAH